MMMDDLVKRLRALKTGWTIINEAADRINELEADNARLRAVIQNEIDRSRRHLSASTLAALSTAPVGEA
jgi:hypothetical protein